MQVSGMSDSSTIDEIPTYRHTGNSLAKEDDEIIELKELSSEDNISLDKELKEFRHTGSDFKVNKCNFILGIITRIILAISLTVFLITFIFSIYGVILINFIFFISSMVSYVFSPMYHVLSGNWNNYVFATVQVFLASPLIEFYIFFIFKSVKYFADAFPEFGKMIAIIFQYTIRDKKNRIQEMVNVKELKESIWKKLLELLIAVLILALMILIAFVTFCIDKLFIIIGLLAFFIIMLQIFALMLPVYKYWMGLMLKGKVKEWEWYKIHIYKIFTDFEEIGKELDQDQREEKHVQTQKSSLTGYLFDDLEVSSDNSWNSENNDVEDRLENEEHEMENESKETFKNILPVILAYDYLSLYEYGKDIALDRFNNTKKRTGLIIFTLLNIAVLLNDVDRIIVNYNNYFLASIILRFIFLPLLSYFHIFTVFWYRTKDRLLQWILWISAAFTIIVFVGSLVIAVFAAIYQDKVRIRDLTPPASINMSIANQDLLNHAVCTFSFEGISIIDAIGFSLGPYDVTRDELIFDNQMKYFFGQDWKNDISYQVKYINSQIPFIIYEYKNMTIVGFRGFTSGAELSLQMEIVTAEYVIPFFQDIAPFYDYFSDWWIEFYIKFAHNFGMSYFDPTTVARSFIDPIQEIAEELGFKDKESIVFTGINIGGIFAKIIGILNRKNSIAFLSLPAFNDFFKYSYDLEDSDAIYVTNIFNFGGFYSIPEPDLGTNIGIPWITNSKERWFCSSGICSLSFLTDSVYKSFCTISEMCGKSNQFGSYCKATIGDKEYERIRKYLLEFE